MSCKPQRNRSLKNYCGYTLSTKEYNDINQKANEQQAVIYKADSLWSIYNQVNDTLRQTVPDHVEFEIFLNTLDKNHFSVVVVIQKNQEHIESIACKFMNAKFQGNIPDNRLLLLHSYTNPDGSGETPLELAIKNISN